MAHLHPTQPQELLLGPIRRRELLYELTRRDFFGRYKGSIFGIVWSLFNPLLMLAIYTFVFSVAFRIRWGAQEESDVAFAIVLFAGMIVHGFFAECLNRAPSLVLASPNYVKKVVFPLELLPWVAMGSALFQFLISFAVLLAFCVLTGHPWRPGILLVPVVMVPLVLTTLGLTFALASLGVFVRDLTHAMGMLTTVALFLAPVFYPIDALPPAYQPFIMLNPISLPIIQLRDVVLWGNPLDWGAWALSLCIGCVVAWTGFWWFQRSRRGFADVL